MGLYLVLRIMIFSHLINFLLLSLFSVSMLYSDANAKPVQCHSFTLSATTCRPFFALSVRQTSFLPILTPLRIGLDIWDQLLLFKQHIYLWYINIGTKVFIILIFMRALAGWPVASSCIKYKVRTLKNKIKSMSVLS